MAIIQADRYLWDRRKGVSQLIKNLGYGNHIKPWFAPDALFGAHIRPRVIVEVPDEIATIVLLKFPYDF